MNCKKCDQTAIDLSIRSLKDIPKVQNVIKERSALPLAPARVPDDFYTLILGESK